MHQKIEKFKEYVVDLAKDPGFIHHKWFVKYHLEIVEKIAMELCDIHPEANRELVSTLVWLHDLGKMVDFEKSDEMTQIEGKKKLLEIGFPENFVGQALHIVDLMDKSTEIDLNDAPIEGKIMSSADGAAHFIGPFFSLWWLENSERNFEDLMRDNIAKARKDWERKIVLPEVKNSFKERYDFFIEQGGKFPSKYIDHPSNPGGGGGKIYENMIDAKKLKRQSGLPPKPTSSINSIAKK